MFQAQPARGHFDTLALASLSGDGQFRCLKSDSLLPAESAAPDGIFFGRPAAQAVVKMDGLAVRVNLSCQEKQRRAVRPAAESNNKAMNAGQELMLRNVGADAAFGCRSDAIRCHDVERGSTVDFKQA